jgi:hypothetical protein
MKVRYSHEEIAKAALCSLDTVKKAVERGNITDDLVVLLGWVIGQRAKSLGIGLLDECVKPKAVFPKMVTQENVRDVVEELGYVPDDSQAEGKW